MADEHIKSSPHPGGPAAASSIAPGAPPAAQGSHAITSDVPAPRPIPPTKKKPIQEYKDGTREVVETIVFVVVLVLLLKTFLAEAFVIPTGSMATTLLGYHKELKCEQCDYFPVRINVSSMVDPDEGGQRDVPGGHCPNCDFYNRLNLPKREEKP
jgi:signal peptidase I